MSNVGVDVEVVWTCAWLSIESYVHAS